MGLAFTPVVLYVAGRVRRTIDNGAVDLSDVSIKGALALFSDTNPGTGYQMIVLGVATAEAPVSQQDAVPHDGIVVVMVVTHEYAHHVAALIHGCEHARVESG